MTSTKCPLCDEPVDHVLDDFEVASTRYAHAIKFGRQDHYKYCHYVRSRPPGDTITPPHEIESTARR